MIKKSVLIKVGNKAEQSIEYDADTFISIGVQDDSPSRLKEGSPNTLFLSSMKQGETYTFYNYPQIPFQESDTILIKFGEFTANVMEPDEIIEHEDIPTCSYCRKDKTEVEYLFEKDKVTYLCSECVERSYQRLMQLRKEKGNS